MRKYRWLAIVLVVVFLTLALVLFVRRDRFVSDEKAMLKGRDEAVSVVSREPERHDERITKKITLPIPKGEEIELSAVGEHGYDQLQERAEQFFQYLDRQDYIKAHNLEEGSYRHFMEIISKLSSHPPVVSGEADKLFIRESIMAHFYRVIGRKDIALVKDILSHEGERFERAMEVFYQWGLGEVENKSGTIEADMNALYDYAAFFLNTLGGKAYLLRRESQVRILLTYYSVLILDRAQRENPDRYRVDILPHVDLLIEDIGRYNGLDHKDTYLKALQAIRENRGHRG